MNYRRYPKKAEEQAEWEQYMNAPLPAVLKGNHKRIKEVEERRPGRHQPWETVALKPVALCLILAFGACTLSAETLMRLSDRGVFIHPVLPGGAAALVISFIFFQVRQWVVYDKQENTFGLRAILGDEEKEEPPDTRVQPWIPDKAPGRQAYTLGRYSLTQRQWTKLATDLKDNEWCITRDILNDCGGFRNVSANYHEILKEFVRIGWIPENYGPGPELTTAGKWAMKEHIPPHPTSLSPVVARNGVNGNDDDANDGGDWR